MNHRRTILIVEDNKAIARGLRDLLQSENYLVHVASDGRAALTGIARFHPHLVLLDLNLPKLSGLEVCRQLRAQGYHNPVIIVSSRTEQVDKVTGLDVGASDYITKPFDSQEMLARIRAQFRSLDNISSGSMSLGRHPGEPPRRLLSIMFTDMKDFSRKMNVDEQLALSLLNRQNAIVTRAVKRHAGRIIEVIGDAFLVSFESALNAVRCGLEIQRDLQKYNRKKTEREHLGVRIGIHLGDVIEVEGKLRGDAINIVARLQQIAADGYVNISGSVFATLQGKLKVKSKRLGNRRVKNIKQPIVVYRIEV